MSNKCGVLQDFIENRESLIVKNGEVIQLEPDIEHLFSNITIKSGGTLTANAWNGQSGGKLVLNITGTLLIESNGKIDMTGKGYKGGKGKRSETDGFASSGESYNGKSSLTTRNNYGGGGGGKHQGGGGGGYGTNGSNAYPNTYRGYHVGGKGGIQYGNKELNPIYLGSGGGSGHPYFYIVADKTTHNGGNGGGIIILNANIVNIKKNGKILSNGENGRNESGVFMSAGGAGSGGSIYITAKTLHNDGIISAIGGIGGKKGKENGSMGICSNGGNGGNGRIRIDYNIMTNNGKIDPIIGYSL
eukprot:CAMPEP_0114691082 /NCGR_PEP_ID=MMETSP0191-20121206/66412_1 /TAXON_ID=126664 /ORGANISM="Sorites sp." /LENGTH=301 /DNA_ID=CAMNT_0001981789 /DNA_START=40 /DNA_END=942 /DNA_ORIENTATION=+